MKYFFNKETNTVKYYPVKASWRKYIGPLEYFLSPVFVRGGLWFKGKIDVERFIKAMGNALIEYDFFLSFLYRDENGQFYACYPPKSKESDGQQQLEIEKRQDSIECSALEMILPKKIISPAQFSGFTPYLKGVSIGALKLTVFSDGFVVGYNVNHTFFDQAGIFYFCKYLSHLYTYGSMGIELKNPYIFDSVSLENENIRLDNVNEAREYGVSKLGVFYTPISNSVSPDDGGVAECFSKNSQINLMFDLKRGAALSKGDIINAVLFKVYTFTSSLSDDQDFTMVYSINIRSKLGLGQEAIGYLVHHGKMILKVNDIREKSLLDLAKISRESVLAITMDQFKDDYSYYKCLQENGENMLDYVGKPMFNYSRVTNWTSFDYHNIQFDDVVPFSLRTPCITRYGYNIISFNVDKNDGIIEIGKSFIENYNTERYESTLKPEAIKKKRSRAEFLNEARFNIQVIATAYIHFKNSYGNEPFLISIEVNSMDEKWDNCCTIREHQAISLGGSVLDAFNFTKENELMSIFKYIGNDIERLSKMAQKLEEFESLICHSDSVFGPRLRKTWVQFKCGENHKYCEKIEKLAKDNNFFPEDISLLLRAYFFVSPFYQGNHIGSNFFYEIIETQKVRPKKITLISKSTKQATEFWFSKIGFLKDSILSNKGTKKVTLDVVDDFLKLLKKS
ncbi:hypothetical protein DICPUDRAFT_149964 [Dictyostelium purpureum]|uniref:Uncharacterized protein n=1 Tax=Dictyostelium purpureum TaxID=5786 RepID=F0ZF42_DICPU|nr:uncharacterized protein DICPUDRAFT_149964 [Dictyostelium purpureum]EGC37473.1 hypothetical protein DICPUDRAFT_149964 [Dictyostelium purpureum]|eukprot:XP_003286037.1 hypothetical protein DICPUDRAFT_149964 [Dictyostelium purpureum]